MPSHSPIGYGELPEVARGVIDDKVGLISHVFLAAVDGGTPDLVLHVFVAVGGEVNVRAFDRSVYQKDVLLKNPKDSAEDGSFFETLNEGHPDASGFWVVLEVENDDEFLFRMIRSHN